MRIFLFYFHFVVCQKGAGHFQKAPWWSSVSSQRKENVWSSRVTLASTNMHSQGAIEVDQIQAGQDLWEPWLGGQLIEGQAIHT